MRYLAGRKTDNELYLNDNGISRVHFTVYNSNNQWYVKDGEGEKNSINGTW